MPLVKFRYKDIAFFCFKLVILFLLLWAIYKQLFQQHNISQLWYAFKQGIHWQTFFFFSLTILLVIPNFVCETQKWRILMNPFYPVKWIRALKAILVGTTMAIFTPNRVGEYVGRALYIPQKYTIETITVTVVGSLSQIIVILFFGLLSLFFLKSKLVFEGLVNTTQLYLLAAVLVFILVCLSYLYYKIDELPGFLNRLNFLKKYLSKLQVLRHYSLKNLLNVQFWSMLKFAIFTTQFVLLLLAFNMPFSIALFFMVMFIFLIQTLVPSVALLEIGVRTNVALFVLGLISDNAIGILSASLLLWMINLMLPALVGAFLLFKIKNSNS